MNEDQRLVRQGQRVAQIRAAREKLLQKMESGHRHSEEYARRLAEYDTLLGQPDLLKPKAAKPGDVVVEPGPAGGVS